MEHRLSGIPRRIGGRSSSADGNSFAPMLGHGVPSSSSRLSRPMSKLSVIDPGKRTDTARRSRSGTVGVPMTPTTPMMKIPFPRLTATPSTNQRNRTPSAERGQKWKKSVERAVSGIPVKDQRPITNPAWQRAQLGRLQRFFEEMGQHSDMGFSQPAIQRPLTIARFVDLVALLLRPLIPGHLNVKNYVTKLPLLMKKLLYPGIVSASWLKAVNTLHVFPHAISLLSYLMDLSLKMTECDSNWLYNDADDVSFLKKKYLSRTWGIFQESGNFEEVNDTYIEELKNALNYSEENKTKLREEIESIRARLDTPTIAADRTEEQQRLAYLNRVRASLKQVQAEVADQRASITDISARLCEQTTENEHNSQELQRLKLKKETLSDRLSTQTMSLEERNKLLDDVDYSNKVIESTQSMIKELEKRLNEVTVELGLAQMKTMNFCVTYNDKLIILDNSHGDVGDANRFIIEQRDLVEPATGTRLETALTWLENNNLELVESMKKVAIYKSAAETREIANTDKIMILSKQLEQLKLLKLSREKEYNEEHQRMLKTVQQLDERNGELRHQSQTMVKEADAKKAAFDEEVARVTRINELWESKLADFREQANKRTALREKELSEALKKRKDQVLAVIKEWHEKLQTMSSD